MIFVFIFKAEYVFYTASSQRMSKCMYCYICTYVCMILMVSPIPGMHVCTHIHMHTHTCTHARAHTHTHTHTRTRTHTHTHTHTHTRTHTHTHTLVAVQCVLSTLSYRKVFQRRHSHIKHGTTQSFTSPSIS